LSRVARDPVWPALLGRFAPPVATTDVQSASSPAPAGPRDDAHSADAAEPIQTATAEAAAEPPAAARRAAAAPRRRLTVLERMQANTFPGLEGVAADPRPATASDPAPRQPLTAQARAPVQPRVAAAPPIAAEVTPAAPVLAATPPITTPNPPPRATFEASAAVDLPPAAFEHFPPRLPEHLEPEAFEDLPPVAFEHFPPRLPDPVAPSAQQELPPAAFEHFPPRVPGVVSPARTREPPAARLEHFPPRRPGPATGPAPAEAGSETDRSVPEPIAGVLEERTSPSAPAWDASAARSERQAESITADPGQLDSGGPARQSARDSAIASVEDPSTETVGAPAPSVSFSAILPDDSAATEVAAPAEPARPLTRRERFRAWRFAPVVEIIATVALALVLAESVQAAVVKPFVIPSQSMEPTLLPGQRVLVNRLAYDFGGTPSRGDIVVFHPPSSLTCKANVPLDEPCPVSFPTHASDYFVKRVIGLPGDRLSIRDGHPVINGKELTNEPYITPCGDSSSCDMPHTIVIPPGEYYMLGDNRGDSDDSRYWGPVPLSWIIGEVFATYWPIDRIGFF
jgi:signal peptidase I